MYQDYQDFRDKRVLVVDFYVSTKVSLDRLMYISYYTCRFLIVHGLLLAVYGMGKGRVN